LDEADALKKELAGRFLMKEEATKANFTKHLNEYDILHLSTHASGGSFSIPAHLTFIDSIMLIYDLYALEIKSQLVVLSACDHQAAVAGWAVVLSRRWWWWSPRVVPSGEAPGVRGRHIRLGESDPG
jgi:hypothetical protein